MNKRELIERIKGLENIFGNKTKYIQKDAVIRLISELDEPQKVTIPQFVADWIKYCKNTNLTMTRALIVDEVDFYNYANQKDESRLIDFLRVGKNQETFARAWLDGYEVEKEKRYLVKIKGVTNQTRTLKRNIDIETWYFGNPTNYEDTNAHHTRKELEEAGFGWVFDCPGIEIEEVEE